MHIFRPWLFALIALSLSAVSAVSGIAVVPKAVLAWQEDPGRVFNAEELDLEDFLWRARPIVVFADSAADPRLEQQLTLLAERVDELVERDVVIVVDTDPAAQSALRTRLRPRGFMMVLIGKDGGVKLRKPFPWDVRALSRVIDKTPLRQQEIRDRRVAPTR